MTESPVFNVNHQYILSTAALVTATIGLLVLIVYEYWSKTIEYRSIAEIPGPESNSWLYGCSAKFGHYIFEWQRVFGAVYRFKACLGDHRIMIADPRAIDYIHKNVYDFPRSAKFREFTRLFTSEGLSWAEGDDHRRQRSVLTPSFSPAHIRELFPKFSETAQVLVEKLHEIVKNNPDAINKEVEITPWLQRATLDVIGKAAFGVNLNALQDQQNGIALIFQDLLRELLAQRSLATSGQPFFQYFPTGLIKYLDYLPVQGARNLTAYRQAVDAVAIQAVASARAVMENGDEGGKEILSQIVRECYQGTKQKLSPAEMYAQFGTFLLAGEDTTANAIGWALLELCNHQNYQKMIREEIEVTYNAVHERGNSFELEPSDLDKMTFTKAFIKESLRYHPSLPLVPREASVNAVFPLSKPVTMTTGKSTSELYIPKGQGIVINIEGYNRLESVWGKDAHVFRPERWLVQGPLMGDVEPSSGVYSHLLTFGGGAHSCIGWRFALQEMQVFLVHLIRNFSFALPDGIEIERELSLGSIPIVKGDPSREQKLPLIITVCE